MTHSINAKDESIDWIILWCDKIGPNIVPPGFMENYGIIEFCGWLLVLDITYHK